MVRFSDMLGGSGEPEEARAATSPYAALASDPPPAETDLDDTADDAGDDAPADDGAPDAESVADETTVAIDAEGEPEPAAETSSDDTSDATSTSVGFESPEDVLVRLTQYATSARAADHTPPAAEPAAGEPAAPEPPADTLADIAAAGDSTIDEEPAPEDVDPLASPGDDFLPRPKNVVRRSRKRRP